MAEEKTFKIALLGYSRKDFDYITRLINLIEVGRPLKFQVGDLSKAGAIECNLAIAVLDNVSNIDRYNRDISQVRKGARNPAIICAAHDIDRPIIESRRSGVEADSILFMPIQPDQFVKVIQRHAISAHPNDNVPADASPTSVKIGELFIKSKLITQEQLDRALDFQKKSKMRLGDTLIELGMITEEQKLECLATQLKTGVASQRHYAAADLNTVALIPEHMAKRFCCIAIERSESDLVVAVTDVLDLKMLDTLRDTTDMRITAILGKKDDILEAAERCYRDIATHNDAAKFAETIDEQVEYIQTKEIDADLEHAGAGAELGIIKLVNILIANAIRDRASDIHIEPQENEVIVRYRIDGDMRRVMSPPKRTHHAIVARIKILSDLNTAQRRLPQDGRMVIKIGKREADIRVSVLPTIYGEKVVLRIRDMDAAEKNSADLGLTPQDMKIFRSQISKPSGIVIVTGPTGSGRSTTLYSALQMIKTVTKNIVTVEDPVEFRMDGVTQVNVNAKAGLTIDLALRSILRQDPDVVLIGEIRDNETAEIAVKMALTGRLVFSTLHTDNAASAIAHFIDIGIPPLLLGSSLNLIVAQRLLRQICPKCKIEYKPDAELLHNLGLNEELAPRLFKGSGCVTCNGTGFMGRTAVFEMLQVSKDIRRLILRNAPTIDIQEQAENEGMTTLRKAGIELALNGTTTIEQVISAAG